MGSAMHLPETVKTINQRNASVKPFIGPGRGQIRICSPQYWQNHPKKRFYEGFLRVRRRKSAVFLSAGDQTGKIGEVIRFLEEMENVKS